MLFERSTPQLCLQLTAFWIVNIGMKLSVAIGTYSCSKTEVCLIESEKAA